jgi:hypothetical protein
MYAPWIKIFNVDAMTVWKWVLYSNKSPSPVLVNHERIHLEQIKRDGVIKFYWKYLFDYLRNRKLGMNHEDAYMSIPYEIEAYENQSNNSLSLLKWIGG